MPVPTTHVALLAVVSVLSVGIRAMVAVAVLLASCYNALLGVIFYSVELLVVVVSVIVRVVLLTVAIRVARGPYLANLVGAVTYNYLLNYVIVTGLLVGFLA